MVTLRAVKKISTRVAGLLMVTILIFVVACSGDVLSLLKGQAETEGDSPLAGQEGAEAQLEITPGGGEISSGGNEGGNDVISSDGKVVPSSPSGTSEPGLEESGGLPEQPPANEGPVPSPALSEVEGVVEGPSGGVLSPSKEWLIYTDTAYGFSIKYPDTYVILPEPTPLPATTPPVVHRVRFQDKQRASGQFANREPAQFAVDVFELDPVVPLHDWLQSAGLVPARATVEQVHLDGAGEGWRVRRPVLMAPNESYFFATEEYVYRLTPLGPHSQDMLASFQLSPGE
jgi:hypothetical protein